MTKTLILILSAFTSLLAVAAMVDGALVTPVPGMRTAWMLGVVLVGVLCWLRWRWHWRNPLLTPALIVGAAMLVTFALSGVGQSVQVSSSAGAEPAPRGIMDVLLGAQAALVLYRLWRDRRDTQTGAQRPEGGGAGEPRGGSPEVSGREDNHE